MLLGSVASRHGLFFDLEYRRPLFAIEHEEIASLVALNDDGDVAAVSMQRRKNRLGRRVVVPKVVVDQLKPPYEFAVLASQRHHRVCPPIIARTFDAVVVRARAACW